MLEVSVQPAVLDWAIDRSGRRSALEEKFPKLKRWVAGTAKPSLKQLETFARAAYVPVGYLLMDEPPEESLPVQDFRTFASEGVRRPSPDLLDLIYLCQRRQAWYQEYAEVVGEPKRAFVGSRRLSDRVELVASEIASTLGFDLAARAEMATWGDALRHFIEQAEAAGILVMVSGVVGSNNRRKLDPSEFRGFALADPLAPVVFINGSDTKSGQMFTLAHELAHIWLGASGVSDASASAFPTQATEQWCNAVAAELLMPLEAVRSAFRPGIDPVEQVPPLSRQFKVSTLVVLRRLLDAGKLTRARFQQAYDAELERLIALAKRGGGGGDYYLTQPVRLSKRFARAVITSTYEGQTLFTDAFAMLGVRKEQTLQELGRTLEVLT